MDSGTSSVGVLGSVLWVDDGEHQDEDSGKGKHYHDTQDDQPQEEDHVHLSWPLWYQRMADKKCCGRCVDIVSMALARTGRGGLHQNSKHMALKTGGADT